MEHDIQVEESKKRDVKNSNADRFGTAMQCNYVLAALTFGSMLQRDKTVCCGMECSLLYSHLSPANTDTVRRVLCCGYFNYCMLK